jgi:hypothetical protein
MLVPIHEDNTLKRLVRVSHFVATCLLVRPAAAQLPVPTVATSYNIDTTNADVRAIVGVAQSYLASIDSTGCRRPQWSTLDPVDRQHGDLTCGFAYQGYPATIVGVIGTSPIDSVYLVRILYAKADTGGTAIAPLALQRLYAVREANSWKLSNAPTFIRGSSDWTSSRYHPDRNRDWGAKS